MPLTLFSNIPSCDIPALKAFEFYRKASPTNTIRFQDVKTRYCRFLFRFAVTYKFICYTSGSTIFKSRPVCFLYDENRTGFIFCKALPRSIDGN